MIPTKNIIYDNNSTVNGKNLNITIILNCI